MPLPHKACPFVLQDRDGCQHVLAFQHPLAGKQWVKGTINPGEDPEAAARRELYEESGLIAAPQMVPLGVLKVLKPDAMWHLFACAASGLPDNWDHDTTDDFGHTFQFFWHPVDTALDDDWHPQFHTSFSAL